MSAPYVVSSAATNYSTTGTSKNVSVNVGINDMLAVVVQGGITAATATPTVTGFSFPNGTGGSGDGSTYGLAMGYTSTNATSAGSVTVTVTETNGTSAWGFTCFVVRNAYSGGTSSSTSTLGTAQFFTSMTYPRQMTLLAFTDAAASDGSSRTWDTVDGQTPTSANGGELIYQRVAGSFTAFSAAYTNASGGFKTYKLLSPQIAYRYVALNIYSDDAPSFSLFGSPSYSATNSKTTSITTSGTNPLRNNALIAFAHVGVQAANGTDTTVTTTATFDGVPMTSLAKVHANNGTQGYIEAFYLPSPHPGSSKNLVVNASTSVDLAISYYYLGHVDLTNPVKQLKTANGSSTAASTSFTGLTERNTIVAGIVSGNNISSYAIGSTGSSFLNLTQNFNNSSNAGCGGINGISMSGTSQVAGWTVTSGPWAVIAIAFNPCSYLPPQAVFGFSA